MRNLEFPTAIKETLEANDIFVSSVFQIPYQEETEFGAELEYYTPAGEDFLFVIFFDGSDASFIKGLADYAAEFDVDEHASNWIKHRGENGTPDSVEELLNDAKAIKEKLNEVSDLLTGRKTGEEPQLDLMLSLSTAHVKPETLEKLLKSGYDGLPSYRVPCPCCDDLSYGALVVVGDIEYGSENDLPNDLVDVVRLAEKLNAWFVRLDRDGPVCNQLTDYTTLWDAKESQK